MKKLLIITGCVTLAAVVVSCKDKRSPGRAYAPDMTYSVAYETYAPTEERLKESGATYNHRPVEGTIARGDMPAYSLENNEDGYAKSAAVKNPLDRSKVDMKEAERLYLIYCGICHGAKLDGNGPLWNNGNGPYVAAPKNFLADDMKAMAEGTMFHSVTYGKGNMGSYASQMSPEQRWMVISYIKEKQFPSANAAAADSAGAKADSVAAPVK
ncbi:MAG TPA: cytochrome c [Chitinophagaceae bacterium]|nr:cytochrome c [Chitinophagaceae bacterium]